jgi:hypothetical protein
MNAKITVPKEVAAAIAHYVNLADTKTEALTDILSMGYEATRSEIILRHFDGKHDELMEVLICGYDVEEDAASMERFIKCDYSDCQNEAAAKGFVLAMAPSHPNGHVTEYVYACNAHKKLKSFFKIADKPKSVAD